MNSSSGSADKTSPHLLSSYYVKEPYRSFPTIIIPEGRYYYAPFTHRADGPFWGNTRGQAALMFQLADCKTLTADLCSSDLSLLCKTV